MYTFIELKTKANLIIKLATLPPQIDYVSFAERRKKEKAVIIIDNLEERKRHLWHSYIERKVQSYYEPVEGVGLSPAEMNAMF